MSTHAWEMKLWGNCQLTKDVDRAQSAPQKALMRIFVPAKADINLDDEEHGSLSSV